MSSLLKRRKAIIDFLFWFQSPLPVKLIVKKMSPTEWIVACMVPKGNMMHCMLKEEEGGKSLVQVKFNTTGKEPPPDIMDVETEMAEFLESGITDIRREGNDKKMINNKSTVTQFQGIVCSWRQEKRKLRFNGMPHSKTIYVFTYNRLVLFMVDTTQINVKYLYYLF